MITWVLIHALYISFIICFAFTLGHKWHVFDNYDKRHPKWMPKRCMWCLAWWLGCIICAVYGWRFGWRIELVGVLPCVPVITLFFYNR